MLGGIVLYFILFWLLPNAPGQMQALASSLGLDWLNQSNPNGWPGIAEVVSRSKYVIFGLILVGIMLLRPQGLLPSQIRKQELRHEEHEALAAPRQLQA
jgi:ABC-type branched-subunit amino acid transport system permease subunit